MTLLPAARVPAAQHARPLESFALRATRNVVLWAGLSQTRTFAAASDPVFFAVIVNQTTGRGTFEALK